MDLGLKGRKALITGASAGLGAAAALALAAEGAEVTINGRSEERLKASAEAIEQATGHKPALLVGDVAVQSDLDHIKSELGPVDILVSNAGGPPPGQFTDHDRERWDEAHALVLKSAIDLTRIVIDQMIRQKWGRLIYITSVGVLQPVDDLILSNTYRAGVTGLCKTISNNYAQHGITANCVCPGYTATERLSDLVRSRAEAAGCTDQEVLDGFAAMIPARRVGQPDELAALITFLASDRAAYITGASIPVDGGLVKSLI